MKKHTNALIHEKSPYLLQHAHNPVNWYPWGDEAFEKAKCENKPVFVSIGYSTCHWCHVMEKESFEDEEVADLLNRHFIAIKVDREERPDIDSIYMRVCQMMTNHGGWPLNVFLTPDQKPFYAGTYFPKNSAYNRPGMMDALPQLAEKFLHERSFVEKVGEQVVKGLKASVHIPSDSTIDEGTLHQAFQQLVGQFDPVYGGFGQSPKFPMPHTLTFLLRYHRLTNNDTALLMVEKTLDSLASSGLYDQIGGGFARYSTDQQWMIPHFEKMLYDQGLLLHAYIEAYQMTKKKRYREIIEESIAFLIREMRDSQTGAFYSAIDADSEGAEGTYYVWSKEEITNLFTEEEAEFVCSSYSITEEGNFEGKNHLHLIPTEIEELAKLSKQSIKETEAKLKTCNEKLLKERQKRIYPHVDDKILTSWNGLIISALAKAGRVLQNETFTELAEQAALFIHENMYKTERLMVRYREGEVKEKGLIDDYAFLLWAYNDLYDATLKVEYLTKAKAIAENMTSLFWDKDKGGFFFTGSDAEQLLVREKEVYDGALPSGNSVAVCQLLRLGHRTGNEKLLQMVEKMERTFYSLIRMQASSHTQFLQARLEQAIGIKEVIVLAKETLEEIQLLKTSFIPEVVWLIGNKNELMPHAHFIESYDQRNESIIYVCKDFACERPSMEIKKAIEAVL